MGMLQGVLLRTISQIRLLKAETVDPYCMGGMNGVGPAQRPLPDAPKNTPPAPRAVGCGRGRGYYRHMSYSTKKIKKTGSQSAEASTQSSICTAVMMCFNDKTRKKKETTLTQGKK